ADNTLTVVDTTTNRSIGEPVPTGAKPSAIAVSDDGKHAYVANRADNSVTVIDTSAEEPDARQVISTGRAPSAIAVSNDGKHAYVANQAGDSVTVIETADGKVVGEPIPTGTKPSAIAVSGDGKHAYVTNRSDNSMTMIDVSTQKVIKDSIPTGPLPQGVSITPDSSRVYVANGGDGSITVVDATSGAPTGNPIKIKEEEEGKVARPFGIAIDGIRSYTTSDQKPGASTSYSSPEHHRKVVLHLAGHFATASANQLGPRGMLISLDSSTAGDRSRYFTINRTDDGKYSILHSSGGYVTLGDRGMLDASSPTVGPSEKFDYIDLGGGKFALRAADGRPVSYTSYPDGGTVLQTDMGDIGSRHAFKFSIQ
uniref:beta-propeller fold lactonase family protein n=1 Tax=Kitasatospora sp. MBT63 TaxID=1444768 RepID=UPI00068F1B2E